MYDFRNSYLSTGNVMTESNTKEISAFELFTKYAEKLTILKTSFPESGAPNDEYARKIIRFDFAGGVSFMLSNCPNNNFVMNEMTVFLREEFLTNKEDCNINNTEFLNKRLFLDSQFHLCIPDCFEHKTVIDILNSPSFKKYIRVDTSENGAKIYVIHRNDVNAECLKWIQVYYENCLIKTKSDLIKFYIDRLNEIVSLYDYK